MKKIIFIFFFLINSSVNAQNAQDLIDGLKKELKTNPDEKRTATIYSDLTWYYSKIATDSALFYGNKAINKAIQLQDSVLISQVYSDIGSVYLNKSEYDNSLNNYQKSLKIRTLKKDFNGINKVKVNIAGILLKKGNNLKALSNYIACLEYFEKNNDLLNVNKCKSNMSQALINIGNYSKAKKYLTEAIEYQKNINDFNGLSFSYNTLGITLWRMTDTLGAIKKFEKSIALSKKCSNNYNLSMALNNLSQIKRDQNKIKEAKELIKDSDIASSTLKKNNFESTIPITTGKFLLLEGDFELAKKQFLKAKQNALQEKSNLNAIADSYNGLAQVNAYLNLPDSTSYYIQKLLETHSEIIKTNITKQNNELETKYQTAKKEQEIAKKNNQIIIGSIIAASMLLLSFLLYKNQKTKNQQQKQESALKEALLKIEAENQLQEQRLGISKELHDNIGSQLTFVISSIDTLKQNYPSTNEKIDNQLENINAFTKNTITELRDTVWVMNTKDIDANALKERLLDNMERAKMTYPNINFKVEIDSFSIDNSVVALNLFRTIQEGINNALKYAKATQIEIGIHQKNDQIEAFVKDNGVGFDIETQIASKLAMSGNGLKNMKKRVKSIKGTFNISSSENFGTKVEISVPRAI